MKALTRSRCIATLTLVVMAGSTGSQVRAEETPTRVIGGATVSARLVSELFSRPVQEKTAIHENMMGATTVGTAWTEGTVMAEFLPHPHHAIVNIRLVGSMLAANQSRRGRITVRSGLRTEIDAEKQIQIHTDGLQTVAAVADCSTFMWIRGITANGRLIERLARRRVERQRSEIQSTTSIRAEREIEGQLDREVSSLMEKMSSGSEGTLSENLPLDVRFQTSQDRLFVSLLTTDIARRPGKKPRDGGCQVRSRFDGSSVASRDRLRTEGTQPGDHRQKSVADY